MGYSMRCPDESKLQDYVDGELGPREFSLVRKHVGTDRAWRAELDRLLARERLLREALAPAPDWTGFCRSVISRARDESDDS